MKKLLITALFGAFAVAQETTPEAAPSNHNLFYSLDADYRLDGNQYEGEHFVKYTYKFADGYKLMPAVSFFTNYTRADENAEWHDEVTHQFARVEWETPKLWDVLGFKTSLRLRYVLNTALPSKDSGSYGGLTIRPQMEQEFGSHFSLAVIPKLTFNMHRNGYNLSDGTRNKLVRVGIEIAPSYKFTEQLALTYDLDVGASWLGNGSNDENDLVFTGDFTHEFELMYTVAALDDLGVGLIYINEFENIGNHGGAGFNKDNETFVGLRFNKDLDL